MSAGYHDFTSGEKLTAATVEEWRHEGEGLLRAGAPIVAYDRLAEGLLLFPGDVRLRQLLALALARTGASDAAIPLLEALRAEGHTDEETIGLLARTYKERTLAATTPDQVMGRRAPG